MNAVIPKIEEPASEVSSMLAVIERAARSPDVDLDKMERLLNMQERILLKSAEELFNAAMTSAQSEMGRISADAENQQTRSRYASYGQLDRHLRPIYTARGFSLSFGTGDSPLPEHVRVLCHVAHSGGFGRDYRIDMPADGKGAKGGDVMTKTHAMGSAVAYGMRYLLKMIFNVAVGEDDDDGVKAAAGAEKITAKQVADLDALISEVEASKPQLLKYIKAERLEDIPAASYSMVVSIVEAKRGRKS